jgi:hypothetical protein
MVALPQQFPFWPLPNDPGELVPNRTFVPMSDALPVSSTAATK